MNDHQVNVPVITIDGPSGTGKGTLCQMLAKELDWNRLDSGAIYRVLAYAIQKNATAINDIDRIVEQAKTLHLRFNFDDEGNEQILLDDMDVSVEIRSEECGQQASIIAAMAPVRDALLQRQRDFAELPGLVTDGRDMGSVVFPDAFLKIYLDANVEERAKRRYLQLQDSKNNASLAKVIDELQKRDDRDANRNHSPLVAASDAVYIDTTGKTIVQVFENVLYLVLQRLRCYTTMGGS